MLFADRLPVGFEGLCFFGLRAISAPVWQVIARASEDILGLDGLAGLAAFRKAVERRAVVNNAAAPQKDHPFPFVENQVNVNATFDHIGIGPIGDLCSGSLSLFSAKVPLASGEGTTKSLVLDPAILLVEGIVSSLVRCFAPDRIGKANIKEIAFPNHRRCRVAGNGKGNRKDECHG